MGGEIKGADLNDVFTLIVEAQADPQGAYLDRVQVVKGWLNESGQAQEQVFNIAWAGEGRQRDGGALISVGNTVDLKTGYASNTIGAARLSAVWQDPDFDRSQPAFYYLLAV